MFSSSDGGLPTEQYSVSSTFSIHVKFQCKTHLLSATKDMLYVTSSKLSLGFVPYTVCLFYSMLENGVLDYSSLTIFG